MQPVRAVRHRLIIAGLAVLVFAVIAAGVANVLSRRPDTGPLAIVGYDTGAQALTHGILRTTDKCVLLQDAQGAFTILVWSRNRTEWKVESREIVHRSREGREMTLRDGETVTLSGAGDSIAEGGIAGDQWVSEIIWVSQPDPSCPTASRWFVNDVVAIPP